jgi:hypothetical protein
MISGERSSRLTTKIVLVEVRELTESTDWFLPFHPTQHESAPCQLTAPPTRLSTSGTATGFFLGLGSSTALCKLIWAEAFERHVPNLLRFGAWLGLEALERGVAPTRAQRGWAGPSTRAVVRDWLS